MVVKFGPSHPYSMIALVLCLHVLFCFAVVLRKAGRRGGEMGKNKVGVYRSEADTNGSRHSTVSRKKHTASPAAQARKALQKGCSSYVYK